MTISVEKQLRPCNVYLGNGVVTNALFHCLENTEHGVNAIVEYRSGQLQRVNIDQIQFLDKMFDEYVF